MTEQPTPYWASCIGATLAIRTATVFPVDIPRQGRCLVNSSKSLQCGDGPSLCVWRLVRRQLWHRDFN